MISFKKNCDLIPLHFAHKCPQNAGNAISETIFQKFYGGMPHGLPYSCVITKKITFD